MSDLQTIKISQPIVDDSILAKIRRVLRSGALAQGPLVALFEERFAQLCGARYGVAISSGTAALHTALYACGIRQGDEVITTPFTFVATANAILMQGARPVFVDIDPNTFNIDPRRIEEKITAKTKAILPVDLYGHPYDVEAVNKIARKYRLVVIEDACQAHGAHWRKKMAGAFGDVGCFSFYATKNMTTGEGGMLVTSNARIAELARRFRNHGQATKRRYFYYDIGFNYRMTEIAAAIGLEQLKKLDNFNQKRLNNARMLTSGLRSILGIVTPTAKAGHRHVFHQYTIRVTKSFRMSRNDFASYLRRRGIESSIFYPKPLYRYPQFTKFGHKKSEFPEAEKAAREVLSLPVHPSLSLQDIAYILKTIREI